MLKIILFAFILSYSANAYAGEDTLIIGGKEYLKNDVIEDFLSVAFSDIPWNADAGEEDRKKIYDSYFSEGQPKVEQKRPDNSFWYSKHAHYVGKGPLYKRNVINRWDGEEITIGFFLPYSSRINEKRATEYNEHNMKHYRYSFEKIMKDGREEIISNATSVIEKQLSALSKVIGKEINIIHPRDVWDSTSEHARIRIIPDANMRHRSWLQSPAPYSGHAYPSEEGFLNGVLFQSYTRRYFDGYLLPESSHEIDISICKINPSLGEDFYTALLNECLLRVLGLPGMSNSSESALSHWHSEPEHLLKYGPWFKIGDRFADPLGEKQKLKYADMLEKGAETYNDPNKLKQARIMREAYENDQRVPLDEGQLESFSTITNYDKFMLRLLYCEKIKSGMTQQEARAVLVSSDLCFK